jgi:hypothetical protein
MTTSDLVTERLEILLLARLTTSKQPPTVAALASESHRYAPATLDTTGWGDRLAVCLQGLEDRAVIDAQHRVRRTDELKRRTGAHAVTRWQPWPERILPALALGVRADDAKAHQRLSDRDAWAAAIVARAHDLWAKGPPPTLPRVCDALAWRALGLTGTPKSCPAEIRAHFLRSYIEIDAGQPERMLRQLAAKLIGAPRADLKALYLALIRAWLTGREPGAPPAAAPEPRDARGTSESSLATQEPSLIDAVRSAARDARDGVFGDRKVFISSVWHALRATPPWSQLDLDDFKARLVSAHRQRELELARADLVAAMDPTLVAASETRTDGATFHFIVREPVQ